MTENFDAILVLSFGGPEKRDDVIPFLENVLRGKPVPRERLLEVAEHYYHFGGVSPINDHCRDLIAKLRVELDAHRVPLPIYWGNRNWHPLLPETIHRMKADGVRNALCYITSGFSCYSGCRQYRENIAEALRAASVIGNVAAIGSDDAPATDAGMTVSKLRVFYNHPDFIAVIAEAVAAAVEAIPEQFRDSVRIAFTAHSIPMSMASTSDYEKQLRETCRLVAASLHLPESRWKLVYQSRSGRPQDPWLEPDIGDHLRELRAGDVPAVVISPVGFLSDHMEVLYDLDDEARRIATELGLVMTRAATPGSHPRFITMIRRLIEERIRGASRACVGHFGPNHDVCPIDCCPAPVPPAGRPSR